jgi:DNA-nicking Smr family endonuclease
VNRRARTVSPEEETLFLHAVRDAKPLVKRAVASSSAGPHRKIFVPPPTHRLQPVESGSAAPFIRGHAEARLRSGRLEPEARIDLHGHSYEGAYRALVSFLIRAYGDGKRLVLVITGKGGVLRPQLPLWLNGPELQDVVIGMREAHAKHGGGGAFYVALHRRKPAGHGA